MNLTLDKKPFRILQSNWVKTMKTKKIRFTVLLALLLAIVTAGAVIATRTPREATGAFVRKLVDRMDITVENTVFSFDPDAAEDGTFELETTVTLTKTEPDFYARLLDISVEGLDLDSLSVADATGAGALKKGGVFLPVEDGKAVPLTLTVTARFQADGETALSPTLVLHYRSGMTADAADERYLEIPLTVTF